VLPYSPIGHLVLFVCVKVYEFLEQKGKTSSCISKTSASPMRIEEPNNIKTKVTLEPNNIHIRSMENLTR
jgi:hypothetical protein